MDAAALDEVYLVSPSGVLLASLKGASAALDGQLQQLTISLASVPIGAQLLVRIVENPGSAAVDSTGALESPVSTIVPFTMNVQRTEMADPLPFAATINSTSLVASLITPLTTLFLSGDDSGFQTNLSSSILTDALQVSLSDSTGPVPPTEATLVPVATEADRGEGQETSGPGVSLGPLVSRSAAPLGPLLATFRDDFTPSIDRTERAFDLSTDRSTDGIDPQLLIGRTGIQHESVEGPSGESQFASDDPSDLFIPLRGPWGFPIMVSSLDTLRERTERAALLATLSPQFQPGSTDAPIEEMPRFARIELPPPESNDSADAPCTDFLTAACGLALGVGLTTGPLYPDLMGLIRTCMPGRVRSIWKLGETLPRRRRSSRVNSWWRRLWTG